MKNILIDLINEGIIDGYLDLEQRNKLIEIIKNIKEKYLYKSLFHGLHHSQKVLLFAYIIGNDLGLSSCDMQIITDAAIYHDIGRIDETEEPFHGLASASKIEEVATSQIYQDEQNLAILKAICDGHSRDDQYMEITAFNYDIKEENMERYKTLYKLLKDADALDRTRFMKTSTAVLNEKYLRFPFSKQLVEFSNNLNASFRNRMSAIHYEKFKNLNNKEANIPCHHGIGFNFFNLRSILKYGLLSNYAKLQKGIFNKRNFYGSNNELWICVTTKNGEASKKFVNECISLQLVVPYLEKGEKRKSFCFSNGLPYDNGYYDDEAFAFYEVPIENIKRININSEILNTNISDLNYLNGSGNLDSLTSLINDYLNNIRLMGFFPDIRLITELLNQYKKEIVNYEKLSEYEQRIKQGEFFVICDYYIAKMNGEIQKWMQQLYQSHFQKEKITVLDVIIDILNELNINYEFEDNGFTLKHGRQL